MASPLPCSNTDRRGFAKADRAPWRIRSGAKRHHPRMVLIGVLPAGRAFCQPGFGKTWLKPPPEKVQATSAAPPKAGLEHLAPTPETM